MWNLTRWFLSSSAFCLPKEKHEHVAIPAISSKDVHGSILIISRSQDFWKVICTYIILVYRIAYRLSSNPFPESIYANRNPASFPWSSEISPGLVQCATSRSTGLFTGKVGFGRVVYLFYPILGPRAQLRYWLEQGCGCDFKCSWCSLGEKSHLGGNLETSWEESFTNSNFTGRGGSSPLVSHVDKVFPSKM